MKRFFVLLLLSLLIFPICARAEGAEETPLCLKTFMGEYILYDGEEVIYKGGEASLALGFCQGRQVFFDNVRIYENIVLSGGEYAFFGNIFFEEEGAVVLNEGAFVTLKECYAEFSGGGITVESGLLEIIDSGVKTSGDFAIKLNSKESLCTVPSESVIEGGAYDIYCAGNIRLVRDGEKYISDNTLDIMAVSGTALSSLISNEKNFFPCVKLYDEGANPINSYKITLINEDGESYSLCAFEGSEVKLPILDAPLGYAHDGWRSGENIYSLSVSPTEDMTLTPAFSLVKPSLSVSGLSFVYDGKKHEICPPEIYHPLGSLGEVTYCWYKDGILFSYEPKILVSEVSDSGKYSLAVAYRVGDDYSFFEVENIDVEIKPRELFLEFSGGKFVAVSGAAEGEKPYIETVEEDGKFYAKTGDANYCLNFSAENAKNKTSIGVALLVFAVAFALIFFVGFFVFKSAEEDKILQSIGARNNPNTTPDFDTSAADTEDSLQSRFFTLTAEGADGLLSSKLAKNMIKKEGFVLSSGDALAAVSIGEISRTFSAGDRVDINKMKERGLLPEGAFRVKVIAEGSIDKALTVCANGFDITAVKMIALLGGEAVKVKSKRM